MDIKEQKISMINGLLSYQIKLVFFQFSLFSFHFFLISRWSSLSFENSGKFVRQQANINNLNNYQTKVNNARLLLSVFNFTGIGIPFTAQQVYEIVQNVYVVLRLWCFVCRVFVLKFIVWEYVNTSNPLFFCLFVNLSFILIFFRQTSEGLLWMSVLEFFLDCSFCVSSSSSNTPVGW